MQTGNGMRQKYHVNGLEVCREVFRMAFPISNATLKRICCSVRAGHPIYYLHDVTGRLGNASAEEKALNAQQWLLSYGVLNASLH